MKATLAALLATFLVGLAPGAAGAQMEEWKGLDRQRCAVVDCTSPSPEYAPRSEESIDTKTAREHYATIHKEAIRVWNQAATYTSFNAKLDDYEYALDLFRQQQKILDGPNVRNAIAQVEAMIGWTKGVLDVGKGNYQQAVDEMLAAYKSRPELFNEANYNYIASVFKRQVDSQPNRSHIYVPEPEATPPQEALNSAPSDRVFSGSPPGVSDRVRKGFQAVAVKDWKVARAWFQDALSLEPDNANLKSFIAIIDAPERRTDAAVNGDSGLDSDGQPLPQKFTLNTLNEHAAQMSTGQVMKALDDILLEHLGE